MKIKIASCIIILTFSVYLGSVESSSQGDSSGSSRRLELSVSEGNQSFRSQPSQPDNKSVLGSSSESGRPDNLEPIPCTPYSGPCSSPERPRVRSTINSPGTRQSSETVLGYNLEQIRSIRLIPKTNLNRRFEIRNYTFPEDKPLQTRRKNNVLEPISNDEKMVLSTSSGDVFGIIQINYKYLRGIYMTKYKKIAYSDGKRVKFNIYSGAIEDMTQEEINEAPLGDHRPILENFRILLADKDMSEPNLVVSPSSSSFDSNRHQPPKLERPLVPDNSQSLRLEEPSASNRHQPAKLERSLVPDRSQSLRIGEPSVSDRHQPSKLERSLVPDKSQSFRLEGPSSSNRHQSAKLARSLVPDRSQSFRLEGLSSSNRQQPAKLGRSLVPDRSQSFRLEELMSSNRHQPTKLDRSLVPDRSQSFRVEGPSSSNRHQSVNLGRPPIPDRIQSLKLGRSLVPREDPLRAGALRTRQSSIHVLGYDHAQVGLIRLIPNTNPDRIFIIRKYTFPKDKALQMRRKNNVLEPMPNNKEFVLSTSSGDVFAIFEIDNIFLRGMFIKKYKDTKYYVEKRVKFNIMSGAIEDMTQEEMNEAPLGDHRPIVKNFRILLEDDVRRQQ